MAKISLFIWNSSIHQLSSIIVESKSHAHHRTSQMASTSHKNVDALIFSFIFENNSYQDYCRWILNVIDKYFCCFKRIVWLWFSSDKSQKEFSRCLEVHAKLEAWWPGGRTMVIWWDGQKKAEWNQKRYCRTGNLGNGLERG